MKKVQSGVPTDLPKDSQAPQMLLGTMEKPVLGSLGHTEAREISVLDTSDATGCHGRAEDRVWTLGLTLAWRPKGKEQGGESSGWVWQ